MLRWPGVIKPGTVNNQIAAHEDMLPTLVAAAGNPDVKEQLLKGHKAGDSNFKVHLDGYNLMPALQGKADWPRNEFIYWTDDGDLSAIRQGKYKILFMEQSAKGMNVWREPYTVLRLPYILDLHSDPFERAPSESFGYDRWQAEHIFLLVPTQAYVAQWLQSFKEFPPRQKPARFGVDQLTSIIYNSMKWYEVVPIAAIVGATTAVTGHRDQETELYIEADLVDAASGLPVAKTVRKVFGKTLENDSQAVSADDFKVAIGKVTQDLQAMLK
jgi:hypothetical protein